MGSVAARSLATPSDAALLRAHDLNLPGSPSEDLVCTVEHWIQCECDSGPHGSESMVHMVGMCSKGEGPE